MQHPCNNRNNAHTLVNTHTRLHEVIHSNGAHWQHSEIKLPNGGGGNERCGKSLTEKKMENFQLKLFVQQLQKIRIQTENTHKQT